MAVNDHALIRFIERYKGVSLDAYRRELVALAAAATPLQRPLVGGEALQEFAALVLPVGRIVTVFAPGARPWRKGRSKVAALVALPLPLDVEIVRNPTEPA